MTMHLPYHSQFFIIKYLNIEIKGVDEKSADDLFKIHYSAKNRTEWKDLGKMCKYIPEAGASKTPEKLAKFYFYRLLNYHPQAIIMAAQLHNEHHLSLSEGYKYLQKIQQKVLIDETAIDKGL